MLINSSGGWVADKGKDELEIKITVVGNDPLDVEHVKSLLNDSWEVEPSLEGETLVLHVSAWRKVTLAEQQAQKVALEKAEAEKAESSAKEAEEKAKADAEKQAKLQNMAAVAASAAVSALKDQV